MRSITIANSRGGTGKTTSARQIASELGKSYRVLPVDLDAQACLTDTLDLEGRQVLKYIGLRHPGVLQRMYRR